MRVTVFGATGAVGSRVVTEALARGHQVTTVLRDAYPAWLHTYNHRRDTPHSQASHLSAASPASRVGTPRAWPCPQAVTGPMLSEWMVGPAQCWVSQGRKSAAFSPGG